MISTEQRIVAILDTITSQNSIFSEMTTEEKIQTLPSESMLTLQFITYLEEEFDIEFEDDELDISFFESIGKITAAVMKHTNEKTF